LVYQHKETTISRIDMKPEIVCLTDIGHGIQRIHGTGIGCTGSSKNQKWD